MSTTAIVQPANFTRRSKSFAAKFAREGRYHFIPLYWLLRLSDFAREGMEHSGSYRFADHLYRGVPSGRGLLGRLLDAAVLKLPAARGMRQRCFEARDAMCEAFAKHVGAEPFRILTVPCGLPRDVRDFCAGENARLDQIEYTGLDLDPAVIEAARAFLEGSAVPHPRWIIGNALDAEAYPTPAPHFIASTGLGEFLDDPQLAIFYANAFDALAPGGTFFTSATARGASDVLLRAFELDTHYRTRADLERLLSRQLWKTLTFTHDATGLQTFVRATKG